MDFSSSLGVHFVQVLEPKNVGHNSDKEVLLAPRHGAALEAAFKKINHSSAFMHYPTMLYHAIASDVLVVFRKP